MKLIVGLGNPGKRYEKTRHNIGFLVLDALGKIWGSDQWTLSSKFNAEITSAAKGKEKIYLVKPMTFMNESGQSVHLMADYYHVAPEDIIIVHDDKDIPLGEIKVQQDRGHAGHNGIRSIIDHLHTKNFHRIRIGIANAKKQEKMDTADFVLGKFGLLERKEVDKTIDSAISLMENMINMK